MNNGDLNKTPAAAAAAAEAEPAALIFACPSSSDDFGRVITRLAVAQICKSLGFDGTHSSVLDTLIEILIWYLRAVGNSSAFNANLSCRTQCNVFDLLRSLEDIGVSISHNPLMEIVDYIQLCQEMPFMIPIPQFPVARNEEKLTIPSFLQMSESPPGKHIPSWLPALPDAHTYKCTPIWKERKSDARNDKIEQARQRRKAERSLLSLQRRLAQCGASTSGSALKCNHLRAQSGAVTSGHNDQILYLVAPLNSVEIRVEAGNSTGVWANEMVKDKTFDIMETFSSAIEAMKDRVCDEIDVDMKLVLPTNRQAVHFRFETGKKVFGQSSDVDLWNKSQRRSSSLMFREDERDDRKRRVEYILRQAAENPYELNPW